jgi:hypothetical protein
MSHYFLTCRTEISLFRISKVVVLASLALAASAALPSIRLEAEPPAVALTQIGSPIWRPVDFQLFTAPANPGEVFQATVDALLPLEPPQDATTYSTPHAPPYDTELSTNAAAAGFVNASVFPREALATDPNELFFGFMLVPAPGVIGSSRDFESGPVIPASLFPFNVSAEVWRNGALSVELFDDPLPLRPTDQPFGGASHRSQGSTYFNRGANNLGNYEFRWSLRDTEGHGWDILAPFQVVPEVAGDFNQDGAVDAADYVIWRNGLGTSYIQAEYDIWRTDFGRASVVGSSVGSGASLAGPNTLPAVPEPSALGSAWIAAIGFGAAGRRPTRNEGTTQ